MEQLFQAIETLEAHESLSAIKVVDYPYMKADKRQKIHKELHAKAFPEIIKKKQRALTLEEIASLMNG